MARAGIALRGTFRLACYGPDGEVKWREDAPNLVTNQGVYRVLTAGVMGTYYVGLTNASPTPAAADTMGSHGGWTEFTGYSQATRPEWSKVRALGVVHNTASKASYAVTAAGTLGGAFLVAHNGKGSVTGPLVCCAANTGANRGVSTLDTVTAQYSFTGADDGA